MSFYNKLAPNLCKNIKIVEQWSIQQSSQVRPVVFIVIFKVKDLKMKSGGANVMLHNCQLRKDV